MSRGNLVGAASIEAPSLPRIAPGDPQRSYLWHKVNGTQASVGGTGRRMPLGGTPLSAAELDALRRWIAEGARNN